MGTSRAVLCCVVMRRRLPWKRWDTPHASYCYQQALTAEIISYPLCQNLVIRCLLLYSHIIYASVHEPLSGVECRISVKGETLTRGSMESEMSPLSRAEYSRKSSGAVCLRVADATV